MPLVRQRSVLLAKTESVYRTDPVPVAANDAVEVFTLQVRHAGEVVDRTPIRAVLGPVAPIQGRVLSTISFDVELKGSGAVDSAADWGVLLQSCGFAETVTPTTGPVDYDPASSSLKSCTIYVQRDGRQQIFTGCRGNVAFRFPVGQPAMMTFTFTGFPGAPTDTALGSPTLDATLPGILKSAAFAIGGFAGVIANLTLDIGNAIDVTDDMNDATGHGAVLITGRTMQGTFDPEEELVATADFWSDWRDNTAQALTIAVGTGTGEVLTLTGVAIHNRSVDEGDRRGLLVNTIPFTAAFSSGDDEVKLSQT